jgi:hypothetical protein
MVTTPDIHLPRRPRAQHRPRQASPSQLDFLATDLSLRTFMPPTTLQDTSWKGKIAQGRRVHGQTIAALPHSHRAFLLTILPFSILQWPPAYRMAERLSSTKSENSEVEYLFVAMRRISKLRERVPSLVRVGQLSMRFLYLCFVSLTDIDYCPVSWHVSS